MGKRDARRGSRLRQEHGQPRPAGHPRRARPGLLRSRLRLRPRQRDPPGHARHRRRVQRGRGRDDDPLQPLDLRVHEGVRHRQPLPADPAGRALRRGRRERPHRVSPVHGHQLPRGRREDEPRGGHRDQRPVHGGAAPLPARRPVDHQPLQLLPRLDGIRGDRHGRGAAAGLPDGGLSRPSTRGRRACATRRTRGSTPPGASAATRSSWGMRTGAWDSRTASRSCATGTTPTPANCATGTRRRTGGTTGSRSASS